MRLPNPFAKKNKADNTNNDVDAATILGEPLADSLAKVADEHPYLITRTASAVTPEDVDDPTVSLIGIVLDTSYSALKYMKVLGQSHDDMIEALKPAQAEGVTILATCVTLDGTVVYPLTRLEEVEKFGRRPLLGFGGNTELDYDHMSRQFNMISNTPLRDRVMEQITALMAERLKWENPRVARTVNIVNAVITDGLDNKSTTTPHKLSNLVGEIEDEGGSFTEVATFIGELNDKFRSELVENITGRRNQHTLPDGYEQMTTEELLRWWFYEQGLAATDDRLWLPGTDPKAIRRATGQMSQVAFQASMSAFAEEQ